MNGNVKRWIKNKTADSPLVFNALKKAQGYRYAARYFKYYHLGVAKASTCEINIEFSSACNLRCSFCALDHTAPKTYMTVEVLQRLLNQLISDQRFSGVKRINLHNGGETLMHPKRLELFEVIAEFKQRCIQSGMRFPEVILLTNGMLLRRELANSILDLNVLDQVGFSLDGGTPESFETLRVNAKWPKFKKNVKDFIELVRDKKFPLKTFGITIIPQPNELSNRWMHPEFVEVTNLLDQMEYRRLHDWGGQVDIGEKANAIEKVGCDMLMDQLVVLPDGGVTVCCNDLNGDGVIGNILSKDLYDIYMDSKRIEMLRKLMVGKKSEVDLCKDCTGF